MNDNTTSSISDFYDANEGFLKGNMFKTIYRGYKKYKPEEIKTKNEKQAMLLFLQKCELAINDLTLYLDIHTENQKVVDLLNFYKKEYENALNKYIDKYGPTTIYQITDTFKWNDEPFPWEK